MAQKNRWFVRRGGSLKGPFLEAHISQYLLLGRITDEDELSRDQQDWQPAINFPHLYPEVLLEHPRDEAKIQAERMKYDERSRDRRKGKNSDKTDSRRNNSDRRQAEPEDIVRFRESHERVVQSINSDNTTKLKSRTIIYLSSVLIILFFLGFYYQPDKNAKLADCNVPPAPNVNWMNCTMPGVDLSNQDISHANLKNTDLSRANLLAAKLVETDLSYAQLHFTRLANANLKGARLKGANLVNADLHYADLTNADLSYADLTDADIGGVNLSNTNLDKAIWIDKRVCAVGSVGVCR